jgi:hypothetical protein
MNEIELKHSIESSIKAFLSGSISQNALNLFAKLGYKTDRQNPFIEKTYRFFKESFLEPDTSFNEVKARVDDWKSIDLLFQLTQEELSDQQILFGTKRVDNTIIETYLFFVIELIKTDYSRGALAQITREINKIFPMPVMLLFKYGEHLTLSVINRRLNKKDEQKDVLEKVTLIKDIFTQKPHRAHIEILFDLSFDELRRLHKFTNFVELHNAWQRTLDIKELNKRFYRELSNWYFWAINRVSFPNDIDDDKDDTVFNSESIIRLLTRLIFIWFIKEKNLIPDKIFDGKEVSKLIKGFNIKGSTVYYRAILQNLFFATLNQKIEERAFATDGTFEQNKKNYGIKNLYRYSSDFTILKDEVIKLFEGVPFLNGGLFDCLDSEDKNGVVMYLDGFSRNPKKQAQVPDELFFSQEKTIDLSAVYDNKKKKNEKVRGLFNIFDHYKFTITENTPIEEEVALDPELLGRVFENLLASYNPETKTTARKQTGSFYTPREIVNYMIDESLKAYIKRKLKTETEMNSEDAEYGLEVLFGYNEKDHLFNQKETLILVKAIDNCKIIDPACGSGAFPMGILHKLVHILHKLDPNNTLWEERQIKKVDNLIKEAGNINDSAIRDKIIADLETNKKDIEESFTNNKLDYGRKLYLIENCIYGVDIQPIATQISKLRFFISLIVDQKADKTKVNFGIRPLPNLETKFVAANTLIGIEKPKAQGSLFDNQKIKELEEKLRDVRHRLFSAKTPANKRKLREEDQKLREEMGKILESSGWTNESARQLAAWDPYDQNTSSPFFDPEWMFGITDGFDVVIANPPYIKEYTNRKAFDGLRESLYYQGKMDLWYFFGSLGLDFLKENGLECFIATNNWITNSGASKFRNKLIQDSKILQYIDFGNYKIFETAGIQTMVFLLQKNKKEESYKVKYSKLLNDQISDNFLEIFLNAEKSSDGFLKYYINFNRLKFKDSYICFLPPKISNLCDKLRCQSNITFFKEREIAQGIVCPQDTLNEKNANKLGRKYEVGCGIFVLTKSEIEKLKINIDEKNVIKPLYNTSELKKYYSKNRNKYWIIYAQSNMNNIIYKYPNIKRHLEQFKKINTSAYKPFGLHRARDEKFFKGEKIISLRKCKKPIFTYVDFDSYVLQTFFIIKSSRINLKYLVALLNSKLIEFWLFYQGKIQGNNYQIDKEPLVNIPIKNSIKNEQNYIIDTIENIINIIKHDNHIPETHNNSKINELEKQIDQMIYQLYELTEDEIEIVENFNKKT